ncbi:taste receptor type 2 member 116-like [Sceloporus undulatus]|uniref:taste receptor type 2 member 116-like n=1 Tax=Sceloporus undulatus TaxID=8520 RepID=UPI001C4D300B|nr:taste receptor type 2 member 116-like [Sceloporus undulatus]
MASKEISPFFILSWIIIGILCIVSFLANGFIAIVNMLHGLQNRKMLLCDFLLTCLSTCRLVTQWMILMHYFLYFYTPDHRSDVLIFSWIYVNMASLCFVSCLSVFYCVKVTNFANAFFLQLKARINQLLPRLLGISLVIFVLSSLPSAFSYFRYKKSCNLTGTAPGNTSQGEVNNIWVIFRPLQITFTFINFSINIAASLILLTSLWRHVRNLRKNGIIIQDFNTQVHLKVMQPLLISLFLYIIFITNLMIMVSGFFLFHTLMSLILEIMTTVCPLAHSIILIWSNPKLKKVAGRIINIRQRISLTGEDGNRYPSLCLNRDCFCLNVQ